MVDTVRFSVKTPVWADVPIGGATAVTERVVGEVTQNVHTPNSGTYFTAREAFKAIKATLEGDVPDMKNIRLLGSGIINTTDFTLGTFLDSYYGDADYFMCYTAYDNDHFIVPCFMESCMDF